MRPGASTLTELANAIGDVHPPGPGGWDTVYRVFQDWADTPGRRAELRSYLGSLPSRAAADVVTRSKEATTHFAWCLLDRPDDGFSLWLHEYKPCRNWLPGYANSVHNHRYHFCTTLLSGAYLHERFTAELDEQQAEIHAVTPQRSTMCREGLSGYLLSHEFHRIPHVDDGTMTFLVKSRMVAPWSLSYDPGTGLSQRHIPMESRLADLPGRL